LLNADEFERSDAAVSIFQTQLNHFTHPLHERIEALGLGVAPVESRNCAYVVTFLVSLDNHCEFARAFHGPILPRRSCNL